MAVLAGNLSPNSELLNRDGKPPFLSTFWSKLQRSFARGLIRFALLALSSVLFAGLFTTLPARAQSVSAEYKVKAAYLYNFVQYVDWPEKAFASEDTPLVIGILGNDPFGSFLDETVRGETVRGRKLEIRRYRQARDAAGCHLLFISDSEAPRLNSILAEMRGRSILTVSDMEEFAVKGGMVRFFTQENKIRFRINLNAAKNCNLAVSSKLLQLAEIVETR